MTLPRVLVPLLLVVGLMARGAELPPPGFIALFNGRDLTGWRGGDTFDHRTLLGLSQLERERQIERWSIELTQNWRAENGELWSSGLGHLLTTVRDFGDFELLAEYQIEAHADTGIYLRGVPQVQLWDPADRQLAPYGADKGSGGLWNNPPGSPGQLPRVRADKPAGEWNAVRILMVGARVSVWLNGQLVVDHATMTNFFDPTLPVIARGPIQLQTHGGTVRWRRIFLREIPASEAHRILVEHARREAYRPLWNGRDATGWKGATGAFQVFKGALRGKPGVGGTMYFDEELADFSVRMEFITAPGGIAGLALRYSGEGDPAASGLCKIQMLDEQFEKKGGPVDARQAHGSAYGLVAAQRGYQRPTGQWNFQEVTVRGSTVRVELNGSVILDADLAKAVPAAYLRGGVEPWNVRPRGYFGLVAESAGVAIRNLELRKLGESAK